MHFVVVFLFSHNDDSFTCSMIGDSTDSFPLLFETATAPKTELFCLQTEKNRKMSGNLRDDRLNLLNSISLEINTLLFARQCPLHTHAHTHTRRHIKNTRAHTQKSAVYVNRTAGRCMMMKWAKWVQKEKILQINVFGPIALCLSDGCALVNGRNQNEWI